jgi:formate-dependent nitrite reductase membrane component NrfD
MPSVFAVIESVTTRHNHHIDPSLHIWGWEIPVYLFLGGLAAGLLVLPALLALSRNGRELSAQVRAMPFAALGIITLGMVALFLDLEYKVHVWRFYFALEPTSPMSWGSWILLVVYPAGLLLGLSLMSDGRPGWLPRAGAPGRLLAWVDARRRGILWSAVIAGVALGTYTGLLLGTLGARPAWNSTLLGPLFLVSGLSTAAALMMLARPAEEEHRRLARWDMALIVMELGLLGLFFLTLATGGAVARAAAGEFLGGRWTAAFWSLVVLVGLVVPLALEIIEQKRHFRPATIAPALILIGGLALRWILVLAGQASSYASL